MGNGPDEDGLTRALGTTFEEPPQYMVCLLNDLLDAYGGFDHGRSLEQVAEVGLQMKCTNLFAAEGIVTTSGQSAVHD